METPLYNVMGIDLDTPEGVARIGGINRRQVSYAKR